MKEESITFDNGAGSKLVGKLAVEGDAPIVILAHGFCSTKESSKNTYLIPLLHQAGIGTLSFDFFGHGESGGDFSDITITEGVADVLAAYAYATERFPEKRIGLLGSSYGGTACYYNLPETQAPAVLIGPALYYFERYAKKLGEEKVAQWKETDHYTYRVEEEKEYWLKYTFYKDLQQWMPEPITDAITSPLLIIHGDADPTVPYEDTVRILERLSTAELCTIPGGDHLLHNPEELEALSKAAVAFFVKHLATGQP